ncbi:MAG: glycosyltransferase family 1 protein [Acidobacteriota bacterium]
MRIGFDVSQTGRRKAGCGYLADGLIRALAETDSENDYILYPAVGDLYWDPECASETFQTGRANFRRMAPPANWEASQSFWREPPPDLEKQLGEPDIFHANNFFCPTGLTRARLVYTLYDLAFLEEPAWTTEANRCGCFEGVFRASLLAEFIIAISQNTRRHFLETFPHYPPERMEVVYPASRFEGRQPQTEPVRDLRPQGFWLSAATLEPRKNHRRLIEAYAKLAAEATPSLPLVLAGGAGWLMEDLDRALGEHRAGGEVIRTGYVSDAQLEWLYENCFAFVYPSLFEGFGMPVLEAMGLGAPVICSNTTSLPEITGPAALLVDPTDVESIAAAMKELASSETTRERLREEGRRRARDFSWAISAERVVEVYRRVSLLPEGARRAGGGRRLP